LTVQPTEVQVQRCCAAVDAAARELAQAAFWQHLLAQLQQLPHHCALVGLKHMVVYGLGSLEQPGALHIRYQLAAAQLLAALLPQAAAVEAFDPVFTPLDRAALAHCGIQVGACTPPSPASFLDSLSYIRFKVRLSTPPRVQITPKDEGGRREAAAPTLFFMPHCEAVLTDALLEANAAAGTLHNVVVLGNRFSGYHASWALAGGKQPGRSRSGGAVPAAAAAAATAAAQRSADDGGGGPARPGTMLRLCQAGAVCELAVGECGFPVASAFNDLGLHWFPLDWRDKIGGSACSGSRS
jgi:hypothetical protein